MKQRLGLIQFCALGSIQKEEGHICSNFVKNTKTKDHKSYSLQAPWTSVRNLPHHKTSVRIESNLHKRHYRKGHA